MKRKIRYRVNKLTPAQALVAFFFGLITCGALLLALPIATQSGESIGLLSGYFTSTSAVCVTGLVVVDTGTTFTLFGKIVIMLLIQFGALGIMTSASLMYGLLRRKMSVSNMLVIREALNQDSLSLLSNTVHGIIKLTVIIELLGAALLSIRFIPMFGIVKGGFYSLFHAVSAFCNAGFDLFGNFSSITSFVDDPLVVLTISGLIIMGGIGFAVIHEVKHFKERKKLSLHAKVVLISTALLLSLGTIIFYLLEMNNPATIKDMDFGTQILSSFFQSVTTRTAGFNTIDQNALTHGSKFVSMVLMLIGASPGSTGGGIKTTTFAIIMLATISTIRNKDDINVNDRRIPIDVALKAFVIGIVGLTFSIVCGFMLIMFETGSGVLFENFFFEAFSAYGTVGLSTGITSTLSIGSRIVLILTMFSGRVGPLTLMMALIGSKKKRKLTRNVEGNLMVG